MTRSCEGELRLEQERAENLDRRLRKYLRLWKNTKLYFIPGAALGGFLGGILVGRLSRGASRGPTE